MKARPIKRVTKAATVKSKPAKMKKPYQSKRATLKVSQPVTKDRRGE